MIKCLSCRQLIREAQPLDANPQFPLVIFGCERFPYWCALSGLLRPSKGIERAAAECPVDTHDSCVVCGTKKALIVYGEHNLTVICPIHDHAWDKWLNNHPGKREYIHPTDRLNKSRWYEVFREYVSEEQAKLSSGGQE